MDAGNQAVSSVYLHFSKKRDCLKAYENILKSMPNRSYLNLVDLSTQMTSIERNRLCKEQLSKIHDPSHKMRFLAAAMITEDFSQIGIKARIQSQIVLKLLKNLQEGIRVAQREQSEVLVI